MFLLSYPERGSCAIQEPLPSTAFMSGNGEGRIVSRLVVMDRRGVRSPAFFRMTTARQAPLAAMGGMNGY